MKGIGSFCSINHTAYVAPNHPIHKISSSPYFYEKAGKVWGDYQFTGVLTEEETLNFLEITGNKPITFGHDVWIGAHAVILPSVTIGNGAIITAAWWEWPIDKIRAKAKLFMNNEEFFRKFYKSD